jgi:hypothetical protein
MDYERYVREALRGVLAEALREVAARGFSGDHHLYVTFDTRAPGVELPKHMHALYPREITIVLQHQFWELDVTPEAFAVTLSFGGVPYRIRVPLTAVLRFVDPSVPFGLTFAAEEAEPAPAPAAPAARRKPTPAARPKPAPAPGEAGEPGGSERAESPTPPPPSSPSRTPPRSPSRPTMRAVPNPPEPDDGGGKVVPFRGRRPGGKPGPRKG